MEQQSQTKPAAGLFLFPRGRTPAPEILPNFGNSGIFSRSTRNKSQRKKSRKKIKKILKKLLTKQRTCDIMYTERGEARLARTKNEREIKNYDKDHLQSIPFERYKLD